MKTLFVLPGIVAALAFAHSLRSGHSTSSFEEGEEPAKIKDGFVDPLVVNSPPCVGTTTADPVGNGFAPQTRLGCTAGDQWEPAIAADANGNVVILETQYNGVPGCPSCPGPTILVMNSTNGGDSFSAPQPISLPSSGQWDPQVVVDPVDGSTFYAAWLQNKKSDIAVARSIDGGVTWSVVIANHTNAGTDKPILAVRGRDVYVAYNHAQKASVSASHDFGATWNEVSLSTGKFGWSLPAGGTVTPSGRVAFSWDGYTQSGGATGPVNLYVTESLDSGRTWSSTAMETSASPPECNPTTEACGWAYLGAQIVLASDADNALYAVWNSGAVAKGPERIYFSRRDPVTLNWTNRVDLSAAPPGVAHAFPAIAAAGHGNVDVSWMDARAASDGHRVWNVYHRATGNGGSAWTGETRVSSDAAGVPYVHAEGFDFPFGDYYELDVDPAGTIHIVWGEGANYNSPGSVWYTRGN